MLETRLRLYEKMYYEELNYKDKLNQKVSTPWQIVTLLIAGTGYLINQISNLDNSIFTGIIIAVLLIHVGILIWTGYELYCVYYNHTYIYISKPILLEQYNKELIDYYEEHYEEYYQEYQISKEDLIKIDYENNLIEQFKEATSLNRDSNALKSKILVRVGKCLLIDSFIWIILYAMIMSINIFS